MDIALSLPIDHPDFEAAIIQKVCKPNGYYSLAPNYGYTDLYNGCLIRWEAVAGAFTS